MNFWHIQLHPNDKQNYSDDEIKEIVNEEVIGIDIIKTITQKSDFSFNDWTEKDIKSYSKLFASHQGKNSSNWNKTIINFRDTINTGDIVLVRNGGNPIALVEVTSDYYFDTQKKGKVWFRHRRRIKNLAFYNDYIKIHPENQFQAQKMGTLTRVDQTNTEAKTNKGIFTWYRLINGTRIDYNAFGIKDSNLSPAFNVDEIADVFSDHLREFKKDNGQMLCVTGKWGRGKTYFIKQVCNKLDIDFTNETSSSDSKFHFAKFHAWKYQDTPAIWAYLYEVLTNNYISTFGQSWKKKGNDLLTTILLSLFASLLLWLGLVFINPIFCGIEYWFIIPFLVLGFFLPRLGKIAKVNFYRKGWLSFSFNCITILGAFIWLFYFSLIERKEIIWNIITWSFNGFVLIFAVLKIASFISFANKPLKTFITNLSSIPTFQHLLGFQSEIQKELIALLKARASSNKRLLLFIDDLDRCSEDRMIQIVDALRVMLENPEIISRMIVLIAVDEEKLKKAIRYKYKELYNGNGELDLLENEYMDKLFISGIKLSALTKYNRVEFFEMILKAEDHSNYKTNESNTSEKENEGREEDNLVANEVAIETPVQNGKKQNESDNNSRGVNEIINTYEELSIQEINNFKFELNKNEGLSPRQIRILYYRYRLARNLWSRLNSSEQFPSKPLVKNLFAEEPDISEAQGKDIFEMVRAY